MTEKDDKKGDHRTLKTLLILAIVVSVVFMMFASYYGIRINKEEPCKLQKVTNYQQRELTNSSFTLANSEDYVLQEFSMNYIQGLTFNFCFDAIVSSGDGVRAEIINQFGKTLAVKYLDNTTINYCSYLDADRVEQQNFLGVKCVTCNSTSNVTLQKEITGAQTVHAYYSSGNISVVTDNTLSYALYVGLSCKDQLKFFTRWYFFTLAMLGVAALIIVGYGNLRDFLFKDW